MAIRRSKCACICTYNQLLPRQPHCQHVISASYAEELDGLPKRAQAGVRGKANTGIHAIRGLRSAKHPLHQATT